MELCPSQNLSTPKSLSTLAANGGRNWLTFWILMPGNTQLQVGIWLPRWIASVCGWEHAQEDWWSSSHAFAPQGQIWWSFMTQTRKRLTLLQSNNGAGRRSRRLMENHPWVLFFVADWTKSFFIPQIKTPEPIWPKGGQRSRTTW